MLAKLVYRGARSTALGEGQEPEVTDQEPARGYVLMNRIGRRIITVHAAGRRRSP